MSLKTFHLIFVAAAILLGLGVGGWGVHQYRTEGDVSLLILGLVFLAMGIVLIIYGKRMLKKTKDIGYLCLAGFFLLQQNAAACATCYGESDAPMAEGMNAGIFTLFAIIGSTLMAIAGFFVFLIRRGARVEARKRLLADPTLLGLKRLDLSQPAECDARERYTFQ